MQHRLFYRFGQFIYHFHRLIIFFWILVILSCIPFIPHIMAPFKSTGFVAENSQSAQTDVFLEKKLGFSNESIVVLYSSQSLSTDDSIFMQKIKKSLSGLSNFPIEHTIIYPKGNKNQISKDKHTAYAVILFKNPVLWNHQLIEQFQKSIKEQKQMRILLGGQPIMVEDVNKQTQKDLYKADAIGVPIALLTLIIVFASLIAALVPVLLGGGCAILMLSGLYFLGHLFDLSIFTINIALLLGLCLSLDYSLFIIYRFRSELLSNSNLCDTICMTLATAGNAVFFSGLAVFISLSALLFFPINILFSIGVGGLVAVFIAVIIAITLLPAVLVVLQTHINSLPIRFKRNKPQTFYFWRWLANIVVKHRFLFFILMMSFLLILGSPFLKVNFGISDVNILPKETQSRQFHDQYQTSFNAHQLTPIKMVVVSKDNILSKNNLAKLYRLTDKLKKNPNIAQIDSIVTTKPRLNKEGYYALYRANKQSDAVETLLNTSTGQHFTVINIVSKFDIHSKETQTLINDLRKLNPGGGLSIQLTGIPVNNVDVLESIYKVLPFAIIWILVLTYLVLMILLRSIFLPFKAILMNILSLCASYGVLVFVFQESHFHELLNFTPQNTIDVSLLVIIFGALFGFSMDYEVFLLTRIKEAYDKCHDNNQSIIYGIEQSSRIITSAALIVICTCGSFMVADVLMVKQFGLGIAVAITVDAFFIRSILVPATMSLLKRWNWYFPKWLDKILPN